MAIGSSYTKHIPHTQVLTGWGANNRYSCKLFKLKKKPWWLVKKNFFFASISYLRHMRRVACSRVEYYIKIVSILFFLNRVFNDKGELFKIEPSRDTTRLRKASGRFTRPFFSVHHRPRRKKNEVSTCSPSWKKSFFFTSSILSFFPLLPPPGIMFPFHRYSDDRMVISSTRFG